MWIGLVAHIPHQAVVRGLIDVMQGDSEFYHTEASAKVTAGLADAVEQKGAQFFCQLRQLLFAQGAQLSGAVDAIEQWRERAGGGYLVMHSRSSVWLSGGSRPL